MSFHRLSELVDEAKQMHEIREGEHGRVKSQARRSRRTREVSLLDDLLPDDEADFRRQERCAMEKSEIMDPNFMPPKQKKRQR